MSATIAAPSQVALAKIDAVQNIIANQLADRPTREEKLGILQRLVDARKLKTIIQTGHPIASLPICFDPSKNSLNWHGCYALQARANGQVITPHVFSIQNHSQDPALVHIGLPMSTDQIIPWSIPGLEVSLSLGNKIPKNKGSELTLLENGARVLARAEIAILSMRFDPDYLAVLLKSAIADLLADQDIDFTRLDPMEEQAPFTERSAITLDHTPVSAPKGKSRKKGTAKQQQEEDLTTLSMTQPRRVQNNKFLAYLYISFFSNDDFLRLAQGE